MAQNPDKHGKTMPPSGKKAQNPDKHCKTRLPSGKTAKNPDGRDQIPGWWPVGPGMSKKIAIFVGYRRSDGE